MYSPSSPQHRLTRTTVPAEFTMAFAPTPRGARLARLLVAHCLDSWGRPYDGDANGTLALITAELCANAVRHGRVRVEISDPVRNAGPPSPLPWNPAPSPAAACFSSPPWPATGASTTAAPASAEQCGRY
ncbi:ATP-binding protein [Streptomyces atacamensis]|uniref:ATP-binding protein n=1 Tax=Streptomyces atacamensis TaxID=531966 RepID=UPI00399D537A